MMKMTLKIIFSMNLKTERRQLLSLQDYTYIQEMRYILICFSLPLVLSFTSNAPSSMTSVNKIEWMTWLEASAANDTMQKKILVDVYTDWCGWCKVMDRETFADSAVVEYIKEHFYAVKLNAEQKDDIFWSEHLFSYEGSGRSGVHGLASALLDGEMSYPSLVFLNEKFERIRISKGFQDAKSLMTELKYAAEERYNENPAIK